MKHRIGTKALSMLLALIMVVGMVPATTIAAFADGVPETLVTSLTKLYEDDEVRAREDLEALSAAGILEDGKLVDLDIREGGESVELSALAERIANGESVGEITVNGNAATAEQIVKISQVKAAIEIAQLLDEEIDVTDAHVENLESLLTGIEDGSVDLDSALQTGTLSLSEENATGDLSLTRANAAAALMADSTSTITGDLTVSDGKFTGPYISGSTYEPSHAFALPAPDVTTWYADSDSAVAADGEGVITITFTESSQDLYMDEFSKVHIGSAEGERTDGTITVTATLDKALNVPVSVDCVLSGGTFRTDVSNPASPGLTTQTFTWATGESGAKSITSKIDTSRLQSYPGNRWEGSLGYVFSIVNPRNAKLVDSSAPSKSLDSWNCTVYYKPYDDANYVDEGKTTSTTINRIYVPGGTYYSGQVVPIYVYFNDPVCVGSDTTITVNGTVCKSVCKTDYACRTVTFGYTVQDIDTSSLEITSLDGFRTKKNGGGDVVTITNLDEFKNTRIGAADGVYLSTKVKTRTLDTANAKWGIDDGDGDPQVATVVIPLKGTGDEKQWLTEAATMSKSIQMDLPGFNGTQSVDKYLTSGYFSTDGGKTRYPAYVVGEGEAIVARYTVPAMTTEQVRRDGVGFYLAPSVLTASDAEKYIGASSAWTKDANGYYYFTAASNAQTAPLVSGCAFNYYVKGVVPFDDTQFVTRTQEYENAGNGFIKLKGDDLEFPYVLVGDPDHPENQYDVEILVTKDFYDAMDTGVLYLAEELQDLDLRVSYQISDRKIFSFVGNDQFKWSATADALTFVPVDGKPNVSELQFNKAGENTELRLMVLNGDNAHSYQAGTMKINIRNGMKPFLMIPSTSKVRETLTGLDTDIFFSSNVTESNSNPTTTFKSRLYKIQEEDIGKQVSDQAQEITIEDWGSFDSTNDAVLTRIRVPGFSEPGIYAVVISADYQDVNGPATLTTTAYLKVKQGPAKVSLKPLERYSWASNEIPEMEIGYTLTSANNATVEYTIQKSGENVGERTRAEGGVIPFNPEAPSGLKEAYTITVYARNNENEAWSMDSMLLTVYNANALKLIVKDVAFGDVGGTTGGKAGDGSIELGTSYKMDNSSKITEHLANSGDGKGYQVDYDLDTLRTDAALQRVISANYGSGAWGIISDRMQWSSTEKSGDSVVESDDVTLNYKEEGGFYSDIRNYNYTYYMPTTDFLVVGTDNDTVTITATHGATGLSASVEVEVHTLQDKLYMFRFLPKAETTVVYTNGKNEKRSLKTNANGELVVYEPDGIASDVVTMSTAGGETYVGTILNRNLVSGEKNIVNLQLYPCNNLSLVPISSQTLTFLTPDGKPYSGTVILRGGVYVNDEYVSSAGIRSSTSVDLSVREDVRINVTNGKATVYFDPTQFISTDGGADNIRYVFEYRFDSTYLPGYIILDPASNDPAESIVNLRAISGSDKVPAVIRQDYQQYYDGTTPTAYTRSVMDSTENIGISTRFSKAVLSTDYALLGESVGEGNKIDTNRGYSTYQGENVLTGALYTAEGTKLTGQTEVSADNLSATQILKLSDLNDATTLFVFPFSSIPMLRSVYTMTDDSLTKDGITDEGDDPTPTARIKAVFTRAGMTVRSTTLPFGVSNLSHQKDLSQTGNGAKEIGVEVKNNLKETTDIGAIFRSINVNDMIRKGFVFLGSLSGAGSDGPVNMMILPTQDPATFRIIAFVGANQRSSDDDDGVSVNFNAQDLAEDMNKFQKEMEEMGKDDDNESESNGEGSMELNFYGTIILEAHIGVVDGDWDIAFRGGNVGTNVKGKYEWGQTFFCGPYPAFISFEVGFHADLEVAFGNKGAVRAMLLDAALGVSVEAFAGLGFDLSIVAIQLGIYGQIGADVNFLLLTPSNEGVKTGTKLTISGEIGIKLKVKLLFISYTEKFASTGFNWTKKWNNYDQIKQYWNDQGFGQLFGVTESGRAYTMYLFDDGTTIVEIEGGAELENRDYLELAERRWAGGGSSGMRLMSADGMTNVQTNAYPYSHPAFTDDGELFLYVSDNDNADAVESVTSYAAKSGSGYAEGGRVDTYATNVLADLDVVASGTKNNAFAAWVKQVETPKGVNADAVTNDELSMMFNATEIYAASYNGTAWTTTPLTDNYVADMSPTVASYGSKAIVAWRSMNASSMTADGADVQDITAMFDVENNVNYRVYDGTQWKTAQVAYNGNAGTVNAIDSAMLSDGTAILVYTVRTGEDVTTTETFYTVIDKNGAIVTTGRLTKDSYTDTNAQVTAVNEDGGYFVLGWYSEHDAGEGSTAAEYDADGKVTATKAVVAHDIRLARINANGSYDINFPESIGGTGETGISSDFHFSAPANNTALTNVSVVWSQKKDSDKAEDAGKYELNAVRFFQAEGVTGLTAPTDIAETSKNYTIDRFDTYTDAAGAIHAIILGTDYNTISGISVYDSIDLDAAANNTVSSNSDSPKNLDILDGEAISSLKLATGTFPETAADVTADINISEVIPGFTTPVQFTVTNTGTAKLTSVTATVGSQNKEFTGLNLLPNQSATLLMSYSVPEGAVTDQNYTVKSGDTVLGSGTLALNRPDVGISGIKLLQEHDGQREIQVMLSNGSEIPLAGSGKTVKLAFYKDPFHESMIGSEISISTDDYADIDAGTYTTVQTLNVTDIVTLVDGEIPEDGVTVYARAWVTDTEEPNTYNNDNYISFTGLLARNNGEKLTTDTSVEVNANEQSEVTGYTVYADIRNNSMQDTDAGTLVVLLLDAEGGVIAQKNLQETSLTLTKEQTRSLSTTFTAQEIGDKAPAQAVVRTVYTVTFDLNGGSSESAIGPVQTDTDGHITLPTTTPTKDVQAGQDPLFFGGWYTAKEGGERITADYTFTSDTTVYAHYVNHQHELTYSASGTTIIATCANSDGFCYLDETDGKHTATLTLAATENNIYTGSAIGAIILDANGIQGDAKVLYATKGEGDTYGTPVETVPVNVGAYKASITLGEGEGAATVSVEYEIKKATLSNVSVAQSGTLTYNGEAQTPQVNTAATAVNNQTVTFTYSLTVDGEYGDMPTFTDANPDNPATVYFKASAANHNDATGSFTVTVNKATPNAPAAPTLDTATASTIRLTEVTGYEYSKDGETWQGSATFTGLEKSTQYTFYQRIAADDNHNESPASVAAQFSTTNHDHNWGSFSADGATITATCGNADTFHSGDLSATMTIAKPTLTTYGQTGDNISAVATVTNNIAGINTPTIVYKQGETVLDAAPTVAGTYTASITLAAADIGQESDVTASVTYTISKAPLTVTANDKTITYGMSPVHNDVTFNGFVNDETASVLGGALSFTYSYEQYGDVGDNYTITPAGLTSNNYDITFVAGKMTVNQKEVGLEWTNTELTYNGEAQKPTATATELVNNDVIGVTVTGEQTNASATAYTATATGFTGEKAGNYKLPSAVTQTFTIGKAALTVTAKPKTITYGDAPANDGVEYEGFVNGETAAVLGGTLAYDYSYTQYGDVDDYSITPKGLTSGNYNIAFADGTLTVVQKEIGLDWTDLSFPFDGQTHKPTVTPTGVVNNDAIEIPVYGAQTNVGTYTASVGLAGVKAANYMLPGVYTHSFEITQIAISGAIVQLAPYAHGTAVSTPVFVNDSVDGANGTIVEGDATKHVDYYYQATAFLSSQTETPEAVAALAATEGVSTTITPTTFDVGKHYVLAVVTGDNYSNDPYYITQSVFEITQNIDTVRTAPTAPTVDGTTVTVAEADRAKALEYSLDGQTWLPVTLDEDGSFKAEWPNAVSGAALKLRETADANYSKPSAAAQGSQTVTTTTFTVTYDANGGLNAPDPVTVTTDKTVRVSAQSGMTRTGHTFDGWNTAANGSGTPYAAGDTVNTGMKLYAQWTENTYTVQFSANGGTGTMEKLENVSYTEEKTLPANSFARTDYNFIGWSTSSSGSVMYPNGQKIKGLATGGTVTLYAVWAKDLYTLRGTIYENDGTTPVAGAEIKLKLGSTVVETKVSAADGTYNFTAAPPALYNIVATKDDVTKTELADLTENKTIDLTMPDGQTSSILDVQGSNTPPAVVGGLEDVAADEEIDGRSIVVTMTVKAQSESENADAEEIGEVASGDTGVLLLEITVEKEIKRNGNVESTEAITDTGNTVVEIIVPYDFNGKSSVKVYRCHGDDPAEELELSDTGADGTYKLDRTNGRIYIYASKFSTYAIGYKTYNYAPSTYKLTVLDSEHGTVIADKTFPEEGAKVTLTVTPDEGYELDTITATNAKGNEVKLTKNEDGTYTFKQPDSKVTVTATFKEVKKSAQTFFVDVAEDSYYYDAVKWAVENGITNGVDETHFAPNASCTRAQMVTFLWRAAGEPEPTITATAFTDVDESAYYYKAVLWAYENGITLGTSDTTFSPNATVTRAQSVTFLFRALSGAAGAENPFEDVKDGTYYADAVKWAYENGITLGTSDTMFSPENDCLRAQIVTFLYRAYNEA